MISKFRFLVTNSCNYNCLYCHNEGQSKEDAQFMKVDQLIRFLKNTDMAKIQRITFSGGEPFLNKDIFDMIEFAFANSSAKIFCATNTSMLNEDLIKKLSAYDVRLTINFPSADKLRYGKITNSLTYDKVVYNLSLLKRHNIFFVLNFVLSAYTSEDSFSLIDYCIKNRYNLKILPFTNSDGTDTISHLLPKIYEALSAVAYETVFEENRQRTTYYTHGENGDIRLRIYTNPCYTRNVCACKSVEELRVLPDFTFKTCMLSESTYPIILDDIHMLDAINDVWSKWNDCRH